MAPPKVLWRRCWVSKDRGFPRRSWIVLPRWSRRLERGPSDDIHHRFRDPRIDDSADRSLVIGSPAEKFGGDPALGFVGGDIVCGDRSGPQAGYAFMEPHLDSATTKD